MTNKIKPSSFLNKKTLASFQHMDSKTAFTTIYENQFWGTNPGQKYYSGDGSHDERHVEPYIQSVNNFLTSLENPPTIIDLGCGDFSIGKQLVEYSKHYFACDIVEDLISNNQLNFNHEKLTFLCIDAEHDKLPQGDVLILRQVLQHLSNHAITLITKQFINFKYIILTEHLPMGEFIANKDKSTGPDSRLRFKSGIDLTKAPFELSIKNQATICETFSQDSFEGVIRTIIYSL